jgi:hypothetical protein
VKRLPPLSIRGETALGMYDGAVKHAQARLAREWPAMRMSEVVDLIEDVEAEGLEMVRRLREEETPSEVKAFLRSRESGGASLAAQIWRLRFQPQDL